MSVYSVLNHLAHPFSSKGRQGLDPDQRIAVVALTALALLCPIWLLLAEEVSVAYGVWLSVGVGIGAFYGAAALAKSSCPPRPTESVRLLAALSEKDRRRLVQLEKRAGFSIADKIRLQILRQPRDAVAFLDALEQLADKGRLNLRSFSQINQELPTNYGHTTRLLLCQAPRPLPQRDPAEIDEEKTPDA
jgi:hypothetical protein